MRWWRRRHLNGDAARAAQSAADDQLAEAQRQRSEVDETVQAADVLARRVDRFTREVERSWHVRRSV